MWSITPAGEVLSGWPSSMHSSITQESGRGCALVAWGDAMFYSSKQSGHGVLTPFCARTVIWQYSENAEEVRGSEPHAVKVCWVYWLSSVGFSVLIHCQSYEWDGAKAKCFGPRSSANANWLYPPSAASQDKLLEAQCLTFTVKGEQENCVAGSVEVMFVGPLFSSWIINNFWVDQIHGLDDARWAGRACVCLGDRLERVFMGFSCLMQAWVGPRVVNQAYSHLQKWVFHGKKKKSRGSFQLENSHRSRDTDILLSGKTVLHKLSSSLSNKMMSVK